MAGVLLILFGLRFLRKGFARVMGSDMLDWLQGFTRTRSRAWLGGVAGGAVMPSSTAMALLSVQMTRAGKIAWTKVFAVLLGAQLGTTLLIQVLAFDLQSFMGLFIAVGGLLFLFVDSPRPRGIGQALLAFGFMLAGMGLLSDGSTAVSGSPFMEELFALLSQAPWVFLVAAILLTLLLQSATASIAVAIALVASGQITPLMLILWVMGANIGLALTVLIAGWNDLQGRRLGIATLSVKAPLAFIVALLAIGGLALPPLPLELSLAQQAAWAHTLFNLLACLAILAAPLLERGMRALLPDPAETDSRPLPRLDPLLLQNPALATDAALREILRLLDVLHTMREAQNKSISQPSEIAGLTKMLSERARSIAAGCEELSGFIDEIADDSLAEEDQALKDTIDHLTRELPMMAELAGPIMGNELKQLISGHEQAAQKSADLLQEASLRFLQQMTTVTRMLMRQRPDLGRKILERKQEHSHWLTQMKRQHAHLPNPVWRILDDYQQLNRRLASVVYVYTRTMADETLQTPIGV